MTRKTALSLLAALAALIAAPEARAQLGGRGGPTRGGAPTQSSPTRNTNVGPRAGASGDDEPPPPPPRSEPTAQPPDDPLDVPESVKERIGSDWDGRPAGPAGAKVERSFFPYYQERRGDYRLRLLPPFYLEHTRGLDGRTGASTPREDVQSLTALTYYRRRSPDHDADVVFPLAWHVRNKESRTYVLGPIAHREAPFEHDNWLAPLFFEGSRKDGGYFHSPALLTTANWSKEKSFTIAGPYFRDRQGTDVDMGVAPLYFHGDNGDVEGNRRTYSLIPPALYFHSEQELEGSDLTVVGPVIAGGDRKRGFFDVAPLFYSIRGRPESGGVSESHTTLFPLFHYGRSPKQTLFVLPGYLRRVTPTVDTLLTPVFSHATTRNGATALTMIGPLAPIFYRYRDDDVGEKALGVFPFYYGSSAPTGRTFMTPLFSRFESYNVSRTYWVFPNLVYERDVKGWSTAFHPLVYAGRSERSTHAVLAPIFWDFASPKGRTTIGFPLYWRFADAKDGTVLQVAANTLYKEKRVAGGTDWQFHLLPLFSYGQSPAGHFWNLLFGLAGYERDGATANIKAFWLPIQVAGPKAQAAAR